MSALASRRVGTETMNLKQLSAFREVMLTGSVSEAARNLYRTQPAISAMIAGLEENVGFELFERRGGRLHPVPEAHYLLEQANAILDQLDSTTRTMRSVRDLEQGTLRIVSMPGPTVFLLPKLISRFVEGREGIKASLIARSSLQVEQLVSVQQYDLGLGDVGFPDAGDSALVDHHKERLDCLCAMRIDDDYAEKDVITAKDLDGRPMATLYPGHPTFAETKTAFDRSGADLNMRFEAQYFIPLFTFVERGLAYSIVDPLSAEGYRIMRGDDQRLVFRPFKPVVHLVASVMTPAHRPLSNLAQAFVSNLKSEIQRIDRATPNDEAPAARIGAF